jgi:hypothetical protein
MCFLHCECICESRFISTAQLHFGAQLCGLRSWENVCAMEWDSSVFHMSVGNCRADGSSTFRATMAYAAHALDNRYYGVWQLYGFRRHMMAASGAVSKHCEVRNNVYKGAHWILF